MDNEEIQEKAKLSLDLILNEELGGYTLMYHAIHGNDDNLPPEE